MAQTLKLHQCESLAHSAKDKSILHTYLEGTSICCSKRKEDVGTGLLDVNTKQQAAPPPLLAPR